MENLYYFKRLLDENFTHMHVSPYSHSFYNAEVDWNHKPEGSFRVSDHWNFTTRRDEKTHCPTWNEPGEKGYSIGVMKDGKYEILAKTPPRTHTATDLLGATTLCVAVSQITRECFTFIKESTYTMDAGWKNTTTVELPEEYTVHNVYVAYKLKQNVSFPETMRDKVTALINSDITAYRVAKETNIAQNTVTRIFNGTTDISKVRFEVIEKLAAFWDESPELRKIVFERNHIQNV